MKLSTLLAATLLALASPAVHAEQAAPNPEMTAHDMSGHDMSGQDMASHDMAASEITLGDLVLSGGFTRATLPGAPVAGGFVTIANSGATDDRLTGGSAAFASEVQVHEMTMEGDVMKMRHLPDGLAIPAGGNVVLKPGSFHLMFMGLKQPLTEGDTVTVDLTFEKAGTVALPLMVMGSGAKSADHMAQ